MVDETSEDEVIRERAFRISDKLDIGDIVDPSLFRGKDVEVDDYHEEDEALGDILDPFSNKKGKGEIQRDGTVKTAPESDIVTDLAKDGERGINWILMGTMILVYSAIGIQIGFVFEPILATVSLIFLAGLGFYLGERWSSDNRLRVLGITWVIISMKVLYGLSVELQRWGFVSVEGLGALLIVIVCINIAASYRYEHDAIAAQSTLVLLAVGSTAGSLFGQEGVALMILISTILVHSLAIHRQSGNLAALGIASSNLWIGMHATTDGFEIGELRVMALDRPLLLFVLLMGITALNASMATRFAKEDNWFSKGMKVLGLGRPGLWGVSVSLGLMGALLAVAANRGDLGYALGLVTVLTGAFSGSYLVVRGVSFERVLYPLSSVSIALLILLIYGQSFLASYNLSEYSIFTILGSATVGAVILRDQDSVTDRVLWMGVVAILSLLVILVPAESVDSGGDGGVLLLGMLSILHIGSGALAIKRKSPSLAGVTVLLPWTWIIIEQFIQEAVRTILISNDFDDPGSIIEMAPEPLAVYLLVCSVMLVLVNERMGKTDVNLASKFLGISEISASIRDSGGLQLWSLGLWLPMVSILFLAQFGGFTSLTMLFVTGALWGMHTLAHVRGVRVGNLEIMIGTIILSGIAIQWRHGMGEYVSLLVCTVLVVILMIAKEGRELFTVSMGSMGAILLLMIPNREISVKLQDYSSLASLDSSVVALICTGLILSIYLPKSGSTDELLKPALSSLWLMSICIAVTYVSGDPSYLMMSVSMFMIATVWLVSRGELRRELQTVAKLEERRRLALKKAQFESGVAELSTFDAREAEMLATRKKSREQSQTDDTEELYTSDISHKPVIVIAVMILVFVSGIVLGLTSGQNPTLLLAVGVFVTILIGIARFRTKQLELDLPHFMGMEMPIAIAIFGLVSMHISSLMGPGSSNTDLSSMGVLTILILELCLISLYQQDNMLDRIPIAVDWFIYSLLVDRFLGVILYESLPWPLSIDPFSGDSLLWELPLLGLELCLIFAVTIGKWIGEMRTERGRVPENGTVAGVRVLSITLLSTGVAGILAILFTMNYGWKRKEPSAVGMAILGMAMSVVSVGNWVDGISGVVGEVYIAMGMILLAMLASTLLIGGDRWSGMLSTHAHILLIIGPIYSGMAFIIPILLILLSTSVWVVGILQLRKSLRAIGLFDLIIAIICSVAFYGSILFQPHVFLLGLTIIAIELGIISWLGLRNEDSLAVN